MPYAPACIVVCVRRRLATSKILESIVNFDWNGGHAEREKELRTWEGTLIHQVGVEVV